MFVFLLDCYTEDGNRAFLQKEVSVAFGSVLSIYEDTSMDRKKRGAFFTPPELASFISRWAVRTTSDFILEPACGEAEFLLAASRILLEKGTAVEDVKNQVKGFELHESSAFEATARLSRSGLSCSIEVGDFLSKEPDPVYDTVVGNPPYVRFQVISDVQRACVRKISEESGVNLSALSSSWAPFVVHSAAFLHDGGRMGLVLPAELLTVNYAAAVRSFLMANFSSIQLVTFDKRVFPEVQEDVVLLLAENYRMGSTDRIIWRQSKDLEDLDDAVLKDYIPDSPGSRWSSIFASREAMDSMQSLTDDGRFLTLESWGSLSLGTVTGNNKYFSLTEATIAEYSLSERDYVAMCPPGSRHLRRLSFDSADMGEMQKSGKATKLFYPNQDQLSPAAELYIRKGERDGVPDAYKCRKRNPWWRVPLTKVPDMFITYMNGEAPSLCTNDAGVHNLNSCHGLYLDNDYVRIGRECLPLACLNSATLFSAEIVGRAYGGGMLKLEPREAAELLVPAPKLVEQASKRLSMVKPCARRLLSEGKLDEVVALVDSILLEETAFLGASEIAHLSAGYELIRLRRKTRSKSRTR